MKSNTIKKRVCKNLSPMQKAFANAINYDALEKAMQDPEFLKIIKKIKL